ncbi:MAG TPA: carbonic anhydrase family protein [Thermoanaerobaculia bacterium]|nr:carbonic anhydrase family protein [Thermoanaerobaculia bacterium]
MKTLGRLIPVSFAFALLALVLAGAPAAATEDCSYSYEGATGPEHWWEICPPANYVCKAGTRQSPIDLPTAPEGPLPRLAFKYRPTAFEVENNGHTIEVKVAPGSFLRIGQERYKLVQFHFHTPSEHKLQGQTYPMELHFVHRNALGELAVVGVFLREGAANPVIQEIWDHILDEAAPAVKHEEELNPKDLLPADRSYYRYAGSLTTPPCTEGVRWHVLDTPIEVSAAQIEEFRDLFPLNARPVQPLNGRPVFKEDF